MVENNPTKVGADLAEGRVACPWCGGVLAPWSFARRRYVRSEVGPMEVRPRRGWCKSCARTHILLPDVLLWRRVDTVAVIGRALVAMALGAGGRGAAVLVGRPFSTVRGWARRARKRAAHLAIETAFDTTTLLEVHFYLDSTLSLDRGTPVTTAQSEGTVLVPVPAQFLPDVYQLLAELMKPATSRPDHPSTTIDDTDSVWTRSMVVRLRATLRLADVRTLLDALARSAPEEIPMTVGAGMAGVSYNKLRGQLAALTKVFKRDFKTATWPIHIRYNDLGQAFYSMSPEVARWWLGDSEVDER